MGLNFPTSLLLGHVIQATGLRGADVYCLGYPTCKIDQKKLARLAATLGLDPGPLKGKAKLTTPEVVRFLGGGNVRGIDISAHEGADIVMDLSKDTVPPELQGVARLILDNGTLEHVAHVPNALKVIHDLLAVGGVVVHSNPANGYIDHGFFQFSPTFYNDWYRENAYEVVTASFSRYFPDSDSNDIRPYAGDLFRSQPFSAMLRDYGFGNILFAARKTPESTCDRHPVQSVYRKRYMGQDYGHEQRAPLTYSHRAPLAPTLLRRALPPAVKRTIKKFL